LLTVTLALLSAFTVFAMLTAVESGIPVIYVELLGFIYYLVIGLFISWNNKRCLFIFFAETKKDVKETNVSNDES
jgi:hypothetical protein